MLHISNFSEAQNVLRPYYDNSRTPYALDTMLALMEYLGNPQNNVKVLHVAGTSGKTSTAYYTAALLHAAGHTVGLSVSPHVDTINERLQINGQLLPEAEFCNVLSEFIHLVEASGIKPSYFELLAAMAYWEFARRNVEYAVIEVGLGGLLDGTNVVSSPNKVCIITDIGLDHTEILGDTLAEIMTQKAGIIKPQNTVFMYEQSNEVMAVVREVAKQKQAELYELPATAAEYRTHLPPFQQRNLGLAARAVDYVLERDSSTNLSDDIKLQVSKIIIPARLERFTIAGKTVLVDGSHNQQKLQALLAGVAELHPNQPIAVLCAFMSGNAERWHGALQELVPAASHLIFTSFYGEQDMPKKSITTDELVRYCVEQGVANYTVCDEPADAFALLLSREEPVLLITGSFYLLNHIRPLLLERA